MLCWCSMAARWTLASCGEFFGQPRQFEIVRGEQRVAAVVLQQVARDGVGEGEAVEGAGAAPDLVHQHQAFFGGVVQDVGGLGHLDHEGGASAGEVVRCADAREDLVDLAQHRSLRRDEAADMREQRDDARPGACRWICRPCWGR